MADFGCQPLDRGGDHAKRGEIHCMPVARDDLRGNRLDRQPHCLRHIRLHPRVDLRESADRAGNRASRDLGARGLQARFGAVELGVGIGEFQPEGRRLGMDAVRTADCRRALELARAPLERGIELLHVGDEQVGGAHELHIEAGVEHVRRRHALVHEARFRPDDLGKMGQKGDDVVLGLALDLLDARDVEGRVLALGPDGLGGFLRDDPELRHGVGGMRLDLEPDAKARLGRPDRRHFWSAVARYHRHLAGQSMIRKSGYRFPEKIMLHQKPRAR